MEGIGMTKEELVERLDGLWKLHRDELAKTGGDSYCEGKMDAYYYVLQLLEDLK